MVSKRISSSDWTGPADRGLRRGAFTHRVGEFGRTTDYAWLNQKDPISFAPPPELRGIIRLALVLVLSPLVLVASWLAGNVGVRDLVASDPSGFLLLWGCLAVAVAFWQLVSRSLRLIQVRTFILGLLIAGTAGISIGYAYVAQRAYAEAVVGKPERVFRYVSGTKRMMFRRSAPIFRHQRADGTDIEGVSKRAPLPYGHCITALPVEGTYGFRWLRVTEHMPPLRPGQLGWPIRRSDCFSDKSLAELAQ